MNRALTERRQRARVTWLMLAAIVMFACTCGMEGAGASGGPFAYTQLPYPTYTPYPTFTPQQEIATEAPPTDVPVAQPLPVNTVKPTKPPKPTAEQPTDIIVNLVIGKSDIEVLSVYPSSTTSAGNVGIDIRNNGPAEYNGTVTVACQGVSFMRGNPGQQIPVGYQKNLTIDISLGTGYVPVDMPIDPVTFSYPVVQCVVGVANNKDPNPNNNAGAFNIP